jgi:hypothetical protein
LIHSQLMGSDETNGFFLDVINSIKLSQKCATKHPSILLLYSIGWNKGRQT